MRDVLDSFPSFRNLVQNYENVQKHSLEEWENKIDPVLFDLARRDDVRRLEGLLENKPALFIGNDRDFLGSVKFEVKENLKKYDLIFYVFSGLDDLAILRRMKEYPDETPRVEIEAYWLAECVEAKSVLIINRDKA